MTISARPTSNGSTNRNPAHLGAVRTTPPVLDRDRAIDAWIAELYQAAIRPDGWQRFLVSLAEALRLDRMVVVGMGCEGRELRHFVVEGAAERSALARLGPNLHAAKRLRDQLCQAALERRAGRQLLDRLAVGTLVVDARGRVIQSNRVARDILEMGDGLTQRDGLEAANATDTAALRSAINAVASAGADPVARERLSLIRPSGARPWMVEITRVERDTTDGAAALSAAAAVVVSDGEQASEPSTDALRTYYGLTPAESELAMLLADGLSLEQAGERRGVSRNTARGQLKRIFAKTQTNRQAELVRLILCGPAGLAIAV
jgi:DNA-binding CsgD family transcriptional regulator/PAS domain-containing protein